MKKKLLLLILVFIGLSPATVLADAYQPDSNTLLWGIGDDPANPPSGQLWYTFNDWTNVAGTLFLSTGEVVPPPPDTFPWPLVGIFDTTKYCLKTTSLAQVNGSLVVGTGYEFDLATAGIAGKLITNVHIKNAFWNFSTTNLAVVPAFYDEDDNLVHEATDVPQPGWWQNYDIDFSDNPSKKIKLMVDPFSNKWVWAGNYLYYEQLTITLIDEADAKCGTKYNPTPPADLNLDCKVDADDLKLLAQFWLESNDPAN